MDIKNDLICIYDNTKENINKIILKIYAQYVDEELEKEFNVENRKY